MFKKFNTRNANTCNAFGRHVFHKPSGKVAVGLVLATTLLCSVSTVFADEVNVYSYRQAFLIDPIFDAFTEETGIKVRSVFAKKGLVERLQTEGANSPADLIFTVDIGPLEAALDSGVTQSLDNDVLSTVISKEYRDPDGHWFGLTTRARIIVTSNERMKVGDISSYEDLAEPEFAGRICTRSGKHPYMVALTASMIAHAGEEEARKWLKGVKNNLARKPQGNDRAQVKAIAAGECDIAIINSYYMGAMLNDEEQRAWAGAVDIVFPNQGDRGTHMNISGMSLTKNSPNKENAVKLMEFLAEEQAQAIYAEQNFEYPVNEAVPASGLLQSWGDFKADTLPLSEIAIHRATAIKMADEVNYDG